MGQLPASCGSALKKRAACSGETLVSICKITQCHNIEDYSLKNHCHENFKILIFIFCINAKVSLIKYSFFPYTPNFPFVKSTLFRPAVCDAPVWLLLQTIGTAGTQRVALIRGMRLASQELLSVLLLTYLEQCCKNRILEGWDFKHCYMKFIPGALNSVQTFCPNGSWLANHQLWGRPWTRHHRESASDRLWIPAIEPASRMQV